MKRASFNPLTLRDRRGSVFVEAALSLSLLMTMALGGYDVLRYYQILSRVERSAATTASLVARGEVIRDRAAFDEQSGSSDVGTYMALAAMTAEPEPLTTDGGTVIAAITGTSGAPRVEWVRMAGPLSAGASDRLEAGLPTLPAGMPLVVVEISLPFDTLLIGPAGRLASLEVPQTLRRRVITRPRGGSLETLEPVS